MTQILWEQLRKLIADHIGFCIRQQDLQYFKHKIEKRITQNKLANLEEYYHLLYSVANNSNQLSSSKKYLGEKEWKTLANTITNGESFFFRDRGQFNLLGKTILPEIIASKRQEKENSNSSLLTLKVWSAGCSTGQEAYSLAMLISELIPDPAQWNILIIGTDINQTFLDIARQGIYKQWSFRLTDPLLKTKYFIAHKQHWQVKPYLKSMVTFYQDNLVDVETVSHYNYGLDLVLCRNVFIYFGLDSITKAIKKISSTLRPGGYLISGHAELQAIQLKGFQAISFSESLVYQYLPDSQDNNSLLLKNNNNHLINSQTIAKPYQQKVNQENVARHKLDSLSLTQEKILLPGKLITKTKVNKKICPVDTSKIQLDKIQTLLDKGEYDEVILQARKRLQAQSSCKESYYLLAQAYANQGNLEQAEKNCDRALKIDSIYILPLFLLAQIAEEQNDYRKAKELLKKIIYLEPLSIDAYLDLGAIYSSENDLERSKKMYQAAYDLLQQYPQNKKFSERSDIKISDLLIQIKPKL